jgi:hypothetical protein
LLPAPLNTEATALEILTLAPAGTVSRDVIMIDGELVTFIRVKLAIAAWSDSDVATDAPPDWLLTTTIRGPGQTHPSQSHP